MDKETIKEAVAYEKEYVSQLKLFAKTNPEFMADRMMKGVEDVGVLTVLVNLIQSKKSFPRKVFVAGALGAAYVLSHGYRKNLELASIEEAEAKFQAALKADRLSKAQQ